MNKRANLWKLNHPKERCSLEGIGQRQVEGRAQPCWLGIESGHRAEFIGLKRLQSDGFEELENLSARTGDLIVFTDGSRPQSESLEGAEIDLFYLDGVSCMEDMDKTIAKLKEQTKGEEILGAVMFSCAGRGPEPSHLIPEEMSDAKPFAKGFPKVPCLGFYAGGEIGPLALAANEKVFQTGRAAVQGTAIGGDKIVEELIDEFGNKNPPLSIGYDHPLIVVAPDPKQADGKNQCGWATTQKENSHFTKQQITADMAVTLSIDSEKILNPRQVKSIKYFGRLGLQELFEELVDDQTGKQFFNISLVRPPGIGKSNLVYAAAEYIAFTKKKNVLWVGHRIAQQKMVVKLFSADIQAAGNLFEYKTNELSISRQFRDQINLREVKMRLFTRDDYVKSLSDPDLKKQVCDTLGINDPESVTNQDVVDQKFFYSGINARWFYNKSIAQIIDECSEIVQRLDNNVTSTGPKDPRAVNSVLATFARDGRIIHVYTSCHLAHYIGSSKGSCNIEFLRLFPFVEHTLGTGTPGDIFEGDFRLHLEQCHNLRDAQVAIMGPDKAEDVMVVLGKLCDGDKSKLLCPAGKINILPDPPEDPVALQRTTLRAANVMKVAQWFIPESKTQPFLDFMVLIPQSTAEENRRWASDGWLRYVIEDCDKSGNIAAHLKGSKLDIDKETFELKVVHSVYERITAVPK
ncbi:FIST domain containing protein [Nitzschia inconspicua]|uniref:FIST domain containing protein n=1 Tax=Nitzschia inconspicua TaxID=303405 RepID=A0A9K3M340_9STRA|nr:FIST domain containing protein [Nitzschia inconspicua]